MRCQGQAEVKKSSISRAARAVSHGPDLSGRRLQKSLRLAFVRVKESAGASQLAPWPFGTPLTSPLSVPGSHDHVCIAPDNWPSKQTVPSGLSTVIVQRPPTSCASPLHPLELAMCAIQPVGPHVELAIHVVWTPGSPRLSSEYVPSNGSHARAGPARPTAATAAIVVAVRSQAIATMFRLLAGSKCSGEAMAIAANGSAPRRPRSRQPACGPQPDNGAEGVAVDHNRKCTPLSFWKVVHRRSFRNAGGHLGPDHVH